MSARTSSENNVTPAQAEVDGIEMAIVEWRGLRLEVPAAVEDWPAAASFAFEDAQFSTGLRLLLGREQIGQVLATEPAPRNRDMTQLLDTIATTLGLRSAGE